MSTPAAKSFTTNYPFINFCDKVRTICQPLFDDLELSFFSFNRVYWKKELPYFSLCSNAEWIKEYYDQMYYLKEKSMPNIFQGGLYFLDEFDLDYDDEESVAYSLKKLKSITDTNSIAILVKHHLGSSDYIFLGCQQDYEKLKCTLLNHKDYINKFIQYFKCQANDLMTIAKSNCIKLSSLKVVTHNTSEENFLPHIRRDDYSKRLKYSRYYLDTPHEGVYLTSREAECLRLLCAGDSMVKIAKILNLSYSTVRDHIDNTKRKLNCYSKYGLVNTAIKTGVLASIDNELDVNGPDSVETHCIESAYLEFVSDS